MKHIIVITVGKHEYSSVVITCLINTSHDLRDVIVSERVRPEEKEDLEVLIRRIAHIRPNLIENHLPRLFQEKPKKRVWPKDGLLVKKGKTNTKGNGIRRMKCGRK